MFRDYPSSIVYYYPAYLGEAPVDWHEKMSIPVTYQIGIPTKADLISLPKKSCIVIDDSFDEAIKSSSIDHLFRVISGKRQISVMIMTQNNFTQGKYGREIRNSCNFSVLFRNCCDSTINENVARMTGLKKAYTSAAMDTEEKMYPYFFIDQSQQGHQSKFRLFTDIFGKYKICYSTTGMKGYIINAQEFEQYFEIKSNGKSFTAKENANQVEIQKIGEDENKTNTEISKKVPSDSSIKEIKPGEHETSDKSQTDSSATTENDSAEESEKIEKTSNSREFRRTSKFENDRWHQKIKNIRQRRRNRKFEKNLY